MIKNSNSLREMIRHTLHETHSESETRIIFRKIVADIKDHLSEIDQKFTEFSEKLMKSKTTRAKSIYIAQYMQNYHPPADSGYKADYVFYSDYMPVIGLDHVAVLNVVLCLKKNPPSSPFSVSGVYNEDGILRIILAVDPDVVRNVEQFMKRTEIWHNELKTVLRHELEHSYQIGHVDKEEMFNYHDTSEDILQRNYNYLTRQVEVEAFVASLYMQAKKKRITFETSIDNFLKKYLSMGNPELTQDPRYKSVLIKIKQAYFDYAKKRFPKAVYDQN